MQITNCMTSGQRSWVWFLALLASFAANPAYAQGIVGARTIGGGAASLTGANNAAVVTIGQPLVSDDLRLKSGFWFAAAAAFLATGIDGPPGDMQTFAFSLEQNFPNPFAAPTRITYQLADQVSVGLYVYNMLGQRVSILVKAEQPPGRYTVEWDGRTMTGRPAASGVYVYRLRAGDFSETRRMLLVR